MFSLRMAFTVSALCLISSLAFAAQNAPANAPQPGAASGTASKAQPAGQKVGPNGEFIWEEEIAASPALQQSENTIDGQAPYSQQFNEDFPKAK